VAGGFIERLEEDVPGEKLRGGEKQRRTRRKLNPGGKTGMWRKRETWRLGVREKGRQHGGQEEDREEEMKMDIDQNDRILCQSVSFQGKRNLRKEPIPIDQDGVEFPLG